METRCPNCGSPITLDELTRGACSSCNAVLPHVVRAHEQAIAQRLAQSAPAPFVVPAPPPPRLPPGPRRPASRSTLLLTALYGLITVAVLVGTAYLFKRPDDAPGPTTAPPALAAIQFHRCSQHPFSRGSTAAVTIGITNDTSEPLAVHSVEPGQPPITVPVPPGATIMHRTFVMHPWMVQNDALECQGWFVPNQGGALTLKLSAVRAAR